MNDNDRELVRRLFTSATELIETAHNAAVAGQSGEIAAGEYVEIARQLQAAARDIVALAEAAMVVANPDINQRRNQPERSR